MREHEFDTTIGNQHLIRLDHGLVSYSEKFADVFVGQVLLVLLSTRKHRQLMATVTVTPQNHIGD